MYKTRDFQFSRDLFTFREVATGGVLYTIKNVAATESNPQPLSS